jgi:hypothetical protein
MIAPSTSVIICIITLSNGSQKVCAFSLMGFKSKQQKVPEVKKYLILAVFVKTNQVERPKAKGGCQGLGDMETKEPLLVGIEFQFGKMKNSG